MKFVVYEGPSPAVDIVGGFHAVRGEPVEVPDDLAESLCAGESFTLSKKKSTADPAAEPAQEG